MNSIRMLDNLFAEMLYLGLSWNLVQSKLNKVFAFFFYKTVATKLNRCAKPNSTFGKVNIPCVSFLFCTLYITLYLTVFIFIIFFSTGYGLTNFGMLCLMLLSRHLHCWELSSSQVLITSWYLIPICFLKPWFFN